MAMVDDIVLGCSAAPTLEDAVVTLCTNLVGLIVPLDVAAATVTVTNSLTADSAAIAAAVAAAAQTSTQTMTAAGQLDLIEPATVPTPVALREVTHILLATLNSSDLNTAWCNFANRFGLQE